MSVNFPFIFLAIVQLSPLQAMTVAAISVFAQCKFRVKKLFSLVQIGFNVAGAINATAASCCAFFFLLDRHVPLAPSLTAAAIVYFFASTVPVSLVIAWSKGEPVLPLWRASFLWFLPFYLAGAALAGLAHFLTLHYGPSTALVLAPITYTIYRAYNAQIARIRDLAQHIADTEALHLRTIEGLAMAIEAKDADTHDHLLRVRVYVTEMGAALHLSGIEMQAIKTAALLHDIGKLAVPERIINKPGKLTKEEFEQMKVHPAVGAGILERVRFPYPVVPIVRSHHEWWNGMGYPDGLSGEAIPIGARILTVVDSFDAMVSDRPYRRAMPLAEAMAVVRRLSGTQFDPRVVSVMEERYVALEQQARLASEKAIRPKAEIDVSRGAAPGAGFEQDSGDVAAKGHSGDPPAKGDRFGESEPSRVVEAVEASVRTLLEATAAPDYSLGLDDTFAVLLSRLAPLIPFACGILYRKHGEELVPQQLERAASLSFTSVAIPLGEGISGWAAHHASAIVNGNATVEPNYLPDEQRTHDLRSALSVPLIDREHAVFGVLSLYAAPANAFLRAHLRAIEANQGYAVQVLKNAMEADARQQQAVQQAQLPVEVAWRG